MCKGITKCLVAVGVFLILSSASYTSLGADGWPKWMCDNQNTGYTGDTAGPNRTTVPLRIWRVDGGATAAKPTDWRVPIVRPDGMRVFANIGSENLDAYSGWSGALLWRLTPAFWSVPSIGSDGYLYVLDTKNELVPSCIDRR